jgi:hypothetical protein
VPLTVVGIAPHAAFVDQVFMDLLGRSADPNAMNLFVEQLDRGAMSRMDFARLMMSSPEYRTKLVQGWFHQFLGRDADPEALSFFQGALDDGASNGILIGLLVSSDEYFEVRAGGDEQILIGLLLPAILGRDATPEELNSFTEMLDGGATHQDIAMLLLSSQEYRMHLVQGWYQQFLGRDADPTGLTLFTGELDGDGSVDVAVQAQIIGSQEYFDHAILAHGAGGGAGKTPES